MAIVKRLYFSTDGNRSKGSFDPADYNGDAEHVATLSFEDAVEVFSSCEHVLEGRTAVFPGRIAVSNADVHALTTFEGPDDELVRLWSTSVFNPALESAVPAGAARVRVRLKRMHR